MEGLIVCHSISLDPTITRKELKVFYEADNYLEIILMTLTGKFKIILICIVYIKLKADVCHTKDVVFN
jgi:hypothetical protein